MASNTAKLYILKYDLDADSVEKRAPYRDAHRAYLKKYVDSGNVVLAGPVEQPAKRHVTVIRNLSEKEIEAIVKQDPYVVNGVVSKYTIKPFFAAIGDPALKNDLVEV